jgi:hypothetical protein
LTYRYREPTPFSAYSGRTSCGLCARKSVRTHILDVRHEEPESPFLKGWVNIGTFMPRVILAGSFLVRGRWHFYDVTDWNKTVVVELQNERFEQLSVQVADPDAVVQLLKDR